MDDAATPARNKGRFMRKWSKNHSFLKNNNNNINKNQKLGMPGICRAAYSQSSAVLAATVVDVAVQCMHAYVHRNRSQ